MAIKSERRYEADFAKIKAIDPKATYEKFLESKASIMESAIYQVYCDMDELHGVIWMLRNELEKPAIEVNHYQARNVLNAIFSLALKNQTDLMEYADLDY